MASFSEGRLAAIAAVGFIPSVLSVYNWLTVTFSLPVAHWFQPILNLWQIHVVANIVAFSEFAPALMPDWSPDFYALTMVIGCIAFAAAFKYDRSRQQLSPIARFFRLAFTPVALVLMLAIPYLNVLITVLLFGMVIMPMIFGRYIPEIMFQPHQKLADENSEYMRTRQEYLDRQKFYWGVFAGIILAVVTNFFS